MEFAFFKMAISGLLVALVVNLLIPKQNDRYVSRPAISFFAILGSVAGHYAARHVGIPNGWPQLLSSAVVAVIAVLVYLLISPQDED